ncbi:MAG: hypothetical protein EZS28_038418, partial [Streblomastix strix]
KYGFKQASISTLGKILISAVCPSASNRERIEPQINEGHDDNADEEEDVQTDEAALNLNKDYRVNLISQSLVQENLGTQPQNDQGLSALRQMENDDSGFAPVEVQEKPKQGQRSKKSKTESLNPSDENQGSNAQAQTKTTSRSSKTQSCAQKKQEKS